MVSSLIRSRWGYAVAAVLLVVFVAACARMGYHGRSYLPGPWTSFELAGKFDSKIFPNGFSTFPGHTAIDLSPDGKFVALIYQSLEVASSPTMYSVWLSYIDAQTGDILRSERIQDPASVDIPFAQLHWKVKLLPEQNQIFALAGERILVLDTNPLEILQTFDHAQKQSSGLERSYVRDFSVSRNGRILAILDVRCNICRDFYIVRIIDVETAAPISKWKEKGAANHIALSPDGTRVLVSVDPTTPSWVFPANSKNIRIHDSRSGKYLLGVGTSSVAWDAEFLPDNARFVTSSGRGDALKIWDADSGDILKELTYGPDGIRGPIALANNANVLAIATHWAHRLRDELSFAGDYSRLLIWDFEKGELLHQSENLTYDCFEFATKVAISDDGSVIAVGCEDFYLFRSTTGRQELDD